MMLFVAGLAGDFDDVDLKEMFELYGEVASAKLITDRNTGKSKGFGFVEMPNEAEAKETIATLDGVSISRKKISVKEAEAQQPRSGGGSYNSGGYNNSRSYNNSGGGYGNSGGGYGNNGGGGGQRPRKPYNPGGGSGGYNRDRNSGGGGGYNSGGGYNRDNNNGGGYNRDNGGGGYNNGGGYNRDRNNDNRGNRSDDDFNKRY